MPGEGGGEGRWGGMEGSGEGGTVALGRVLVSFWRRQEGEMSGGGTDYRKCISGRVVIGQCGTHWLF